MTHSALAQQLDELASALTRLDLASVEACSAQLEELAAEWKSWQPSVAAPDNELDQLRTRIRVCVDLNKNAERFYAGWSRLASLSGAAYNPAGNELALPGPASLALKG